MGWIDSLDEGTKLGTVLDTHVSNVDQHQVDRVAGSRVQLPTPTSCEGLSRARRAWDERPS